MSVVSRVSDLAGAVRDKINLMVPRLVPAGGAVGEVLTKTSATDFDAGWQAAPASAPLKGTSSVTVPLATFTHVETIAALVVTPAMLIFLALGAHAETDENSAEMLDIAALSGAAGTDQITITLNFAAATSGPVNLNWSAI